MKVIIKKTGEVKEVSFGYATNYLFPQGLAFQATPSKLDQLQAEQEQLAQAKKQAVQKAQSQAQQLVGKKIEFEVKKGQGKKIHGSITGLDIAERLGIDKTEVDLDKPLKDMGEHEVQLKLKGADPVKIKVIVKEAQ